MSSDSNGEQIFVAVCCTVGFLCLGVGIYLLAGLAGTMIYAGIFAFLLARAPALEKKQKLKAEQQKLKT